MFPEVSDDILINPGKGWILYLPSEERPQEIWDVVSVCYLRLDWNLIEPREGEFQWQYLDDNINFCSSHGKKFAFGIMPANTSSASQFVTPEWVFTAGSQSILYEESNGNLVQAPVWNDPVYLSKMQGLINALAHRFDGNPYIAYIDARNCGNWGEWHGMGCRELSDKNKAALIDQWKVFKNTTIIVPTNGDKAEFQARYGADKYGFGIRYDSSNLHRSSAIYALDKNLAVSEWNSDYESLKMCNGSPQTCLPAAIITDYMKKSRFSYDNLGKWGADPLNFFSENTAFIREWANKMGYWFKITEVNYPTNLGNGSIEPFSFRVRNDGVAPIYVNKNKTYVRLALLDTTGTVLAISDPLPGINPFSWKPGVVSYVTTSFSFSQTENAAYLAIGLFSNPFISVPDIKLGNSGILPNLWLPIQGKPQP